MFEISTYYVSMKNLRSMENAGSPASSCSEIRHLQSRQKADEAECKNHKRMLSVMLVLMLSIHIQT